MTRKDLTYSILWVSIAKNKTRKKNNPKPLHKTKTTNQTITTTTFYLPNRAGKEKKKQTNKKSPTTIQKKKKPTQKTTTPLSLLQTQALLSTFAYQMLVMKMGRGNKTTERQCSIFSKKFSPCLAYFNGDCKSNFYFWLCDVLLVKQSCLILEQKSSHLFHLRVIRGRLDYSSHKPDVQSHRQKLGCVLYAHR